MERDPPPLTTGIVVGQVKENQLLANKSRLMGEELARLYIYRAASLLGSFLFHRPSSHQNGSRPIQQQRQGG